MSRYTPSSRPEADVVFPGEGGTLSSASVLAVSLAALNRRYGAADLPPLTDDLERAAHEIAMLRALAAAHAAHGKLRRPAFAKAGLAPARHAGVRLARSGARR